ncbi:hypothetical protein, partial [Alteromonas australica]|uniref:hypothetical protein n=1 Tax=Alteromonas australica TaxID=589873 RepID=UPI0023568089
FAYSVERSTNVVFLPIRCGHFTQTNLVCCFITVKLSNFPATSVNEPADFYKTLFIFVTTSILKRSNVTEERRRDEKKKAYLD